MKRSDNQSLQLFLESWNQQGFSFQPQDIPGWSSDSRQWILEWPGIEDSLPEFLTALEALPTDFRNALELASVHLGLQKWDQVSAVLLEAVAMAFLIRGKSRKRLKGWPESWPPGMREETLGPAIFQHLFDYDTEITHPQVLQYCSVPTPWEQKFVLLQAAAGIQPELLLLWLEELGKDAWEPLLEEIRQDLPSWLERQEEQSQNWKKKTAVLVFAALFLSCRLQREKELRDELLGWVHSTFKELKSLGFELLPTDFGILMLSLGQSGLLRLFQSYRPCPYFLLELLEDKTDALMLAQQRLQSDIYPRVFGWTKELGLSRHLPLERLMELSRDKRVLLDNRIGIAHMACKKDPETAIIQCLQASQKSIRKAAVANSHLLPVEIAETHFPELLKARNKTVREAAQAAIEHRIQKQRPKNKVQKILERAHERKQNRSSLLSLATARPNLVPSRFESTNFDA